MERRFDSLETGTTFYQMTDSYLEHPITKLEPEPNYFPCDKCNGAWNAKHPGTPGLKVHFCPDETVQISPIVRVYGSKRKWRTVWGFEQITDADPKDRTDGREYAKFREIGDAMLYIQTLCKRPAFYDKLIVIR